MPIIYVPAMILSWSIIKHIQFIIYVGLGYLVLIALCSSLVFWPVNSIIVLNSLRNVDFYAFLSHAGILVFHHTECNTLIINIYSNFLYLYFSLAHDIKQSVNTSSLTIFFASPEYSSLPFTRRGFSGFMRYQPSASRSRHNKLKCVFLSWIIGTNTRNTICKVFRSGSCIIFWIPNELCISTIVCIIYIKFYPIFEYIHR